MKPQTALCRLSFIMLTTAALATRVAATAVQLARVPNAGMQPQAAVDAAGAVHLVYLKGDPARSDVFYVCSTDGGTSWSAPLRVNSQPGSAIAMGTARGAHLALGTNGRPHVAWMGARDAEPKAPGGATPMLYARLADDGTSFEPQRNVIAERVGLDGGGSIAADARGHVYVAWHAPTEKGAGEAARRVWVARSADDGRTFAPESALSPDPTGACGCCGMRLLAADDRLFALYRSATETTHRDIYLLTASAVPGDRGGAPPAPASSEKVAPMNVGKCVMSTAAFAAPGARTGGVVAAWETDGRIEFARLDAKTGKAAPHRAVPAAAGKSAVQKHPAVATNAKGETLVAWTEGTGWNKGGAVAWQAYDADDKPIEGAGGRKDGLPAWSLPAAFARADGMFVVMY